MSETAYDTLVAVLCVLVAILSAASLYLLVRDRRRRVRTPRLAPVIDPDIQAEHGPGTWTKRGLHCRCGLAFNSVQARANHWRRAGYVYERKLGTPRRPPSSPSGISPR